METYQLYADCIRTIDNMQAEINALQAQHANMLAALAVAEDFMSGFEDDEVQEGMAEKMAQIRDAIAKAGG